VFATRNIIAATFLCTALRNFMSMENGIKTEDFFRKSGMQAVRCVAVKAEVENMTWNWVLSEHES
jgi:hypothetical protein